MRSLLLARRGENAEMRLKLLTIVDSSATYIPSLWILSGYYMQMPPRTVIAVQNRLQNRAGKHLNGPLLATMMKKKGTSSLSFAA